MTHQILLIAVELNLAYMHTGWLVEKSKYSLHFRNYVFIIPQNLGRKDKY